MLPHDELWHYGVKGMKWGVRKDDRSRANEHKRKAIKSETKATRYRKKAQSLRDRPAKPLQKAQNKAVAKDYDKAATSAEKRSKKHKELSEMYDRLAKETFSETFDSRKKKTYKKTFDRTVAGGLAIGAGAVFTKALVSPTGKMFGERIARYVATKFPEKAAKTAAEIAAEKAFGLR